MRVIIACADRIDDPKWNNYLGVPKHLAPVDGEPLLHRTVQQVHHRIDEHFDDIVVTTSDGDLRYEVDAAYVETVTGTNEYSSTRPLWSKVDRTILLLGDVYFTDKALDTIFRQRQLFPLWFGRYRGSRITASRWGEIFACSWPFTSNGLMIQHLARVDDHPEITRPPGWKLYRSVCGLPMNKHQLNGHWIEINDETDDFDVPDNYRKHPAVRRST